MNGFNLIILRLNGAFTMSALFWRPKGQKYGEEEGFSFGLSAIKERETFICFRVKLR
jgi:hypothetical protein